MSVPAEQARPLSIEERINALGKPPPIEEADAPPVEQAQAEEPEEPVEAEPAESDGEVEASEAPEGDDAEVEEIELSTLKDLASHLGVEESDLYSNLTINVTNPDGTPGAVTLSEWKDAYQAANHYKEQERAVREAKEALAREREQVQAAWTERVRQAAGLLEAAEKRLAGDESAIDWNQLRTEDPAEYAAKRQEFHERRQALAQDKYQLEQGWTQVQAERQAAQEAEYKQHLQKERAALVRAMPEWADAEKMTAGRQKLSAYLTSTGFSAEEINSAADHRIIVLAEKARLWDEHRKAGGAAKQKVVKIAKKVLKPGSKPSRADAMVDQYAKLRGNLRKSGKEADAAALITALRNNPR